MSESEAAGMFEVVAGVVGEKIAPVVEVVSGPELPPVAGPLVEFEPELVKRINSEYRSDGERGVRAGAGAAVAVANRAGAVKLIRDLARQYTAEAFEEIVDLMKNCRDPKVRMVAAKEILDRGWGKPVQGVEVSGADGAGIVVNVNIREKQKPE